MNSQGQTILTINGGSSSIKFALYGAKESPELRMSGRIERIGSPDASLHIEHVGTDPEAERSIAAVDHASAVEALMVWIADSGAGEGLAGVGHRIVHGGPNYHEPQRVTAELLDALRALTALDPAHLPDEIQLIDAFSRRFPDLPQFACFDTAFHHDLPRVARLLAIPRRYEALGVRRYGFHGLSYEFLMGELARREGADAARGRVVLAHLGNGASLAAVRDGKPIDTSMGLTPAAGVPMGTRSGDLDPGLCAYLARTEGMDAAGFDDLVNFRSGLLGVSETSSDMRELLRIERTDPRADEAVAFFCYQVGKWIGAFAAALGGLDTLVFAGGIGEKAAPVRIRICAGLEFMGVGIDAGRNAEDAAVISPPGARVKVHVMRTDEEIVIARAVLALLGRAR